MFDIQDILKYLPHRYPMLLVDRIIDINPGVSCRGIKNVTVNEPFFQGHYPGLPVMPGVLIIEAMAQAGAVILLADPALTNMVPLLGSIDEVKFKKPVVPGDQLVTDVELLWFKKLIGKVKCTGRVDDQIVASCELSFKLIPRKEEE